MILMVEDNEVNQEVINMQLSALGYEAMMAGDGNVALELWKKHDFDLILTDCHMPEMDGFELTIAIRKEELNTGKHIPIIAVTANAMSEELEECYASGMDDCLTKPVEMSDLRVAITKWMPVQADSTTSSENTQDDMSQHPEIEDDNPNTALDPQVLAALTGSDIELCNQLLVKFRDASSLIIDELVFASEQKNYENICAQSHKLKSSAKTVGANALATLCLDLEQAGKEMKSDNLDLMASQLKTEFARVRQYIDGLS